MIKIGDLVRIKKEHDPYWGEGQPWNPRYGIVARVKRLCPQSARLIHIGKGRDDLGYYWYQLEVINEHR
tara:strand:- start:370 stop:576 length:207 start_codon:yes stop_codon:yes gene_type:complete